MFDDEDPHISITTPKQIKLVKHKLHNNAKAKPLLKIDTHSDALPKLSKKLSEGTNLLASYYTLADTAKTKHKLSSRNPILTPTAATQIASNTNLTMQVNQNNDYANKLQELDNLKKEVVFSNIKFSQAFTNYIDVARESIEKILLGDAKSLVGRAMIGLEIKWLKYLKQYNKEIKNNTPEKNKSHKTDEHSFLYPNENHKAFEDIKEHYENEINKLKANIDVLKEQLKISKDKISLINSQGHFADVKKRLAYEIQSNAHFKEDAEIKIKSLESTIYRMQIDKVSLKDDATNKENIINKQIHDINDLNQSLEQCNAKLTTIHNRSESIQENSQMMDEEMLTLKVKNKEKLDIIKVLNEKLFKQKEEMRSLEASLSLAKEGQISNVDVPLDGELFEYFTNTYNTMINNIKKQALTNYPKSGKLLMAAGKISEAIAKNEKGELIIDAIQLKHFTFCRPNFFSFVEHLMPKGKGAHLEFNPPYPDWLHCTIRGILDSKWKECLFSEKNGKRISRFPDYVYSWMGNYKVDEEKRCVREIDCFEKDSSDNGRMQLLLGLQSHRSNANWESYNFREFLEEKFSEDELYFFLHCRFLIYGGPQLGIASGMYNSKCFISYERVFEIVQIVMQKSPEKDRRLLLEKLSDCESYKLNKLLDSAMTLRVLLEYYIREKKVKVSILRSLYDEQASIEYTTGISFNGFKSIIDQFDRTISLIETAELYRESWLAGGGIITFESIVVAMHDL